MILPENVAKFCKEMFRGIILKLQQYISFNPETVFVIVTAKGINTVDHYTDNFF